MLTSIPLVYSIGGEVIGLEVANTPVSLTVHSVDGRTYKTYHNLSISISGNGAAITLLGQTLDPFVADSVILGGLQISLDLLDGHIPSSKKILKVTKNNQGFVIHSQVTKKSDKFVFKISSHPIGLRLYSAQTVQMPVIYTALLVVYDHFKF